MVGVFDVFGWVGFVVYFEEFYLVIVEFVVLFVECYVEVVFNCYVELCKCVGVG